MAGVSSTKSAAAGSREHIREVPSAEDENAPKKRTPRILGGMVALGLVGAVTWHVLHRGEQYTDNAQLEGRIVDVAPRVSGLVRALRVDDDQQVREGDVLLEIDAADFEAEEARARADLAAAKAVLVRARSELSIVQKQAPANKRRAQADVDTANAMLRASAAAVRSAEAQVNRARADRELAVLNHGRAQQLLRVAAGTQQSADQASRELAVAEARFSESEAQLASVSARALSARSSLRAAEGDRDSSDAVDERLATAQAEVDLAEANVERAAAELRLAELNTSYTVVRAPRSGRIANRSLEQGQMVTANRPVLSIIPENEHWVVANFKEDQLADMRVGQEAEVKLDTYGSHALRGVVDSIAAGTGSSFALLPPDNASGNFVKVVQRIPVRVRLLDTADLNLWAGMSAEVYVQTLHEEE